jgi:aromatic-L-amino-acid decarboxylase
MTPEEFRVAGHALIDWIAEHRSRVPDLPVRAQVKPGEVATGLAARAPQRSSPSVTSWRIWSASSQG